MSIECRELRLDRKLPYFLDLNGLLDRMEVHLGLHEWNVEEVYSIIKSDEFLLSRAADVDTALQDYGYQVVLISVLSS
jgi:hypothetical protein